jgi:hypothetical protein
MATWSAGFLADIWTNLNPSKMGIVR